MPRKLITRLNIAALRFYVSSDNTFMIVNSLKKYGAGDPEFLSGNGGVYPMMRTVSVGLNLTF
jgi:hypothetical protein